MNLTEQQKTIVDYCIDDSNNRLVLIDSVAGSGKTTLLKAISNNVKHTNGLYLAYNKSIADSSKKSFPKTTDCRTTHSIAYRATVKQFGLKVGYFTTRNIKENIGYDSKWMLVEDIREFCLSAYIHYEDYAEATGRTNTELANIYLNKMQLGIIESTHDFYLKLFHILLASGDIEVSPYDFIMLDEAGDVNAVTLEIFKLLPAKLKIAVGDPYQNIYVFNHTINCFNILKDEGETFVLSKSFRVPEYVAEKVEVFCKKYLNPNMEFIGVPLTRKTIETVGYIARTNGNLIDKMIDLHRQGVQYGLVRKASEIFKVPLMVASFKYQGNILDHTYKHIQEDIDNWYENKDNLKIAYKTVYTYIRTKYSDDVAIVNAINLVIKHGKSEIFDAYAIAKKYENKKQSYMLLTAHSSKGLEFDEVVLGSDMNTMLTPHIEKYKETGVIAEESRESFNLYYVACTRALVRILNAEHIGIII